MLPESLTLRQELRPGDLGAVIHLHGDLYGKEYSFNLSFEAYVAKTMAEFYLDYHREKDRVWLWEDKESGELVGSLFLVHREGPCAQLRYFLIRPEYRGLGLGKQGMELFMGALRELSYPRAYLLTTKNLSAAASLYTRYGFRVTEEKESSTFGLPLVEQRYDLVL